MKYKLDADEGLFIDQGDTPLGNKQQINGGGVDEELGLYQAVQYLLQFTDFYKEWEKKLLVKKYLTFEAVENTTFKFTKAGLSYSLDNGKTWASLAANTATPTVNAGNKILFKGEMTPSSSNPYGIGTFSSTGKYNAMGNVMSLLFGDNFIGQTDLTGKNDAFYSLFASNTHLVDASNLKLPATTLTNYCYYYMFDGCTSLTSAPELPATTLANQCYSYMFNGCTSLTSAPELPATTLTNDCYNSMFNGCTSLTSAPELPATTLTDYCYNEMFHGCTSLTSAPELPATTLTDYCYNEMFHGCTSLTSAPELPAITLADNCYNGMFSGCTSLTTAPVLPATTLTEYCYNEMFHGCTSLTTAPVLSATTLTEYCYSHMFDGCTSLTTAPELPATTLANHCYYYMFNGCTSLTTAPELPATTLEYSCYSYMFAGCTSLIKAPELPATTIQYASYCYNGMFQDCRNLNYIKAMFTTTPSTNYTSNWVSGVSATGTFVKNSAATWNVTGNSGIPTGWTVETASA